jgi:hypothetical protein
MLERLAYMPPKELMKLRRAAGMRLDVGMTVDLHDGELAMDHVPAHGPIPHFRIESLTPAGAVDTATIKCQNPACGKAVLVHSGDLFQKRYCKGCKPKMSRASSGNHLEPSASTPPVAAVIPPIAQLGPSTNRRPAPAPGPIPQWAHAVPDADARLVFIHLSTHGSATEAEIVAILGSPRAFRRFSLHFDEYVRCVPFRVRVEPAADGSKRYVNEGEASGR